MAEILDVLGWKSARSGSKAHPFASAFDVLGVSIDLSKLYEGIVTLKNKQSRVGALVATMDRLVYEGRVESGVAASLHGQLNEFCTGAIFRVPTQASHAFLQLGGKSGLD